MTDMIDEILKADEEALKAKRARLQTLSKKIAAVRQTIDGAQAAIDSVITQDGLTRSDIAQTFDLTANERRLLIPAKKAAPKSDETAPSQQPFAGQPAAY